MLFDLDRFVEAQEPVYDRALGELRRGRKESHWMWFIFPQIRGLGRSSMSLRYAISSLEEAVAYLAHPILGARLRECTQVVLNARAQALTEIFGGIDAMKFCSCMSLFAHAAPGEQQFRSAIDKYCADNVDSDTIRLLRSLDPRAL